MKLRGPSGVIFAVVTLLVVMSEVADAGPLLVGACYTACNAGAVSCYAAAGLTFGVGLGPAGWWSIFTGGPQAAAAACSAAQGVCMAACTTGLAVPTL
jgi:hypothetical protein